MKLKRVIHPIGQGGFYTETFINDNDEDVFNIIYDCGSETGKPHDIISYLKKLYSKKSENKIDAIFISHLHDDHINGLEWLLSNTTVKYLFLPQLTYDTVVESFLYNYIKSGNVDNESNMCITSLLQRDCRTQVIEIEEVENNDNGNIVTNSLEEIDGKDSMPSGSIITIDIENSKYKWQYIPYNSRFNSINNSNIEDDSFFASAKTKDKIDPIVLKNLLKLKGIDACKEKYEEYYGSKNHNSYSMTLFSGTNNPNIDCCIEGVYKNRPCHCCKCKKHNSYPNFLYTGDFEPNNMQNYQHLMSMLNTLKLWDTITGIQVPHHGSRNNFKKELYDYPCRGYISAGSRNRYKHPNVDTLIKIRAKGCCPIIVSEDSHSIQKEVYKL